MLYITKLPLAGFATQLTTIRLALDFSEPGVKHSAKEADEQIQNFHREGYIELNCSRMTASQIERLCDELEERGCRTALEIPERQMLAERQVPQQAIQEDVDEAYNAVLDRAAEVATWLLAQKEGNPLNSAALMVGLFRLTGDPLYAEAIDYLSHIFPWLPKMLHSQKLWPQELWDQHAE